MEQKTSGVASNLGGTRLKFRVAFLHYPLYNPLVAELAKNMTYILYSKLPQRGLCNLVGIVGNIWCQEIRAVII